LNFDNVGRVLDLEGRVRGMLVPTGKR
jgi:hypothetical protein